MATQALKYPDTVVLIDAHNYDDYLRGYVLRLRSALSALCQCVLVLHSDHEPLSQNSDTLILNSKDIFGFTPHKKAGPFLIPGNPDLKIMRATQNFPDAKYFVRLEFDVACLSDPAVAFDDLLNQVRGADFFATQIASKIEFPAWVWWVSLGGPVDFTLASYAALVTKAFLPLFGFSAAFASKYVKALNDGFVGHYEVLMPTLAKKFGMSLMDIGDVDKRFIDKSTFSSEKVECDGVPVTHFAHPIKNYESLEAYRTTMARG